MIVPALEAMTLKWRAYAAQYRENMAAARAEKDTVRERQAQARAETLESCARDLERWMENE